MTAKFEGHSQFNSQLWLQLAILVNIASPRRGGRRRSGPRLPGCRVPGAAAGVGACVAAKQLRLKLRPDSH